ncbi:hypothetical protein AGABI1DRAFT_79178 [Agaricus bisporus var. burnettii JB137-S8]|uniref:RNA exonuclease 4 n=1 Tax=Agaricus bisporus var. burnettii (strain JB137-S8 / ATCC MYA-4627 / FGSC 10392) TaxID=597362 RepID=K5XMX2_AGABU|nr:uncharacterized protein AGABI1DRAFT_79178 [Agaricus bisporus var. burnettii JB137-S8]EKM75965.1 hypothetical protein AGABI1DRAFT_79178 [Agaricus bisporus var. burnettii JB137-S8]
MVLGLLTCPPTQHLPGRYLAIDCEMVGIGLDGSESSLARVSVVNWYGVVQLDVFVRQRERVVDYRTRWSGIREKDMIDAKPFEEVQKQVADLVKDKILIGHAVHHDLKALLLSHPHQLTRDTQIYAKKFGLTKSKFIALRNLVKEQLGITIQDGEHSSVVDARATMAVFRMHKKEWEKGVKPIEISGASKKRKGKIRVQDDDGSGDEEEGEDGDGKSGSIPNTRKGISSGLSTVGKPFSTSTKSSSKEKKSWWSELPKSGSKGSIRLNK